MIRENGVDPNEERAGRQVAPTSLPRWAREDTWIAWGLFAASFIALLATESTVGFVRDESVYFNAAESYARWFRQLFQNPAAALADTAIVARFDVNHEHPVLMKVLYGLSHLLFHEALGWLRPAAAFRLPAFAIAAIIPALIYLFGSALYGRKAGLFAALSFFLVPRQFFNAQLAAFDMPVAALWLLTVFTFWRAQHAPRYWLYCGLSFGLALAGKHNALFLPFVLGPFALYLGWKATQADARSRQLFVAIVGLFFAVAALYGVLVLALGPEKFAAKFLLLSPHVALFVLLAAGVALLLRQLHAGNLPAFRALAPIAAMAVLGPLVFYVHWPYLWHHPVDRAGWYLAFHAKHEHYTWFYLGTLLRQPPFPLEYVVVKTALTVPTSLFVPMVLGFGTLAARTVLGLSEKWKRLLPSFPELLVGANALAAIAIISHPSVPHFGGVKHWFPSMPFLAMLAGVSVVRGGQLLQDWIHLRLPRIPSWAVLAGWFALFLTPALMASRHIHPYGTSAYSELAGGVPGAASLGMQRQFWSNNVTGVLPWINEHAKPGARVYLHEVMRLSFHDYQRNGMLRPDLIPAGGFFDADLIAYQYHQEFREHEMNIWQAMGTQKPVYGLYVDETPQVVVFARP